MFGRICLTILNTPGTPAGAADPIAFGPPAPGPRDVGMSGCLDVWLSGWMVGWLSNPPSSGSKIGHVGSKN